ncbi:MAG: hypothetical protein HN704_07765 [Bacteroidetes bacterium]|nr:hypothetical protein [Bacteroidota bacterium]MBT6685023.1 hypothetical protein [Bacteroidota bacterium]MBT7143101.1 hypothetical protein [Bacteroidota bacterium]MBT7491486.1 hypothetical protein [Bacteroidota bacterium]
MKKNILLTICFLWYISLTAQHDELTFYDKSPVKKKYDGYIITFQNDTIYGTIKCYDYEVSSLKSIVFWDKLNNRKKYTPDDIFAFKIRNKTYESVTLVKAPSIFGKKRIFITRIICGPMNLYKYVYIKSGFSLIKSSSVLNCIEYFYIKKMNRSTAIMGCKKECGTTGIFQSISQPKNEIEFQNYFIDTPLLHEKIINNIYSRVGIRSIVEEYNSLNKIE